MLKAWNTGHPGGLLTLHANSAADALARLEDLCMEKVAASPKRLIQAAVDLIVFIARQTSHEGRGKRAIQSIIRPKQRGETS